MSKLFLSAVIIFTIVGWRTLPAQERNAESCRPGTPIEFEDNGKVGYLTPSGVVIPAKFDYAYAFYSGVAVACVADRCGPIDTTGKFLAPLQDRNGLIPFAYFEGLGPVNRVIGPSPADQAHGYVDLNGKIIIPLEYSWAGVFDHGMAAVRKDGKMFFIDHAGNRITPKFDSAYGFSEDLAPVELDGQREYIHRDGSIALMTPYEGLGYFSEGLASVRIGGKVGYINKTGEVVVQPVYEYGNPFNEGLAAVGANDKYGYINKSGEQVIPMQYRIVHSFREGVASVQLDNGKWGYIDHDGKFEIPPDFDSAMPFCAGVAEVETFRVIGPSKRVFGHSDRLQGKHGLIDRSGKYIWRDSQDQTWDSPY